MSSIPTDGATDGDAVVLREATELLQQQLIYNGQVLDAALDGLRAYKEGTQALAYLHACVHLAYAIMKMLEMWAKTKGKETYVRKRTKPRQKRRTKGHIVLAQCLVCLMGRTGNQIAENGTIPDVEEEEALTEDEVIEETTFTFEAFELVRQHRILCACRQKLICIRNLPTLR